MLLQWSQQPNQLQLEFGKLGALVTSAAIECKKRGVGSALMKLRDGAGCSLQELTGTVDYFDSAVQFIVNHETAHAYVQQFERMRTGLSDLDRQAFEFLADLTATSWMYRKFVVLTPDTTEYRKLRGCRTHYQAIRANTKMVLASQLTVLAFLGLGEALQADGRVTFEGGRTHPHTMVRYLVQQIHFMTLVLSNYPDAFPPKQLRIIDKWWNTVMVLFTVVGLVPCNTEDVLTNDEHFAAARRAGELAEELGVAELRKAAPFLKSMTAVRHNLAADASTAEWALQLAKT